MLLVTTKMGMQNSPIDCSVIVLTKDNPDELCCTLDSLALQKFSMNCEVVLIESWIDREALIDLVDRYRYALNQYQIIVERVMPPAGIYPSMNYALSIFNGRTVTFLNSGDSYYNINSLQHLYSHWYRRLFSSNQLIKPKAVFGQARLTSYSGNLQWNTPFFKSINIYRWLSISWPCHQAVLFDGPWARNNPYNPSQALSADRHVMLKALCDSGDDCFCSHVIVNYSLSGVSSSPPSLKYIFSPKSSHSTFDIFRLLLKLLFSPIWSIYPFLMAIKSFFSALFALSLKK